MASEIPEMVKRILGAPYGHTLKRLPNDDYSITLHGVNGHDITRIAATFDEAARAALDAAFEQETR